MHISHQISLPADVWSDFVFNLNHCDQSRRQKRNAFFAEIEQSISVRHEAQQILIESSSLDEDAILAALLDDGNQHIKQCHLIEAFDTMTEDLLGVGDITAFHQKASEDRYHHLLTARKPVASYATENADPNQAAAA